MEAIVISDIHIGSGVCQAKLLVDFLERIHNKEIITKQLILNGDVFESFHSRLHKWNWKILSSLRSISDIVELTWVRGNHDAYGPADFIAHLIGANYVDEFIFESGGKKILCIHGDGFDDFISNHPILTWLSDLIYMFLQKIDGSFFLAKMAKHNSKAFIRCAEQVKQEARKYRKKMKCDMVCCGHVHFAAAEEDYYNSGSWCELPCTYLAVEDGKIELKEYSTTILRT